MSVCGSPPLPSIYILQIQHKINTNSKINNQNVLTYFFSSACNEKGLNCDNTHYKILECVEHVAQRENEYILLE